MPRLAGVLGWPVAHSRSPALHGAAYRALGLSAIYLPFAVAPADLAAAVRGLAVLGALGVNVTVPHKGAALALCDEVDEVARAVGAVNTIVYSPEGRARGFNTDVAGFTDALDGRAPGPAVVLGAGGAARAVVLALTARGDQVTVVARDPAAAARAAAVAGAATAQWTEAELRQVCAGARLVVDATSAGLEPGRRLAPSPPLERLASGAVVISLIYHHETALLAEARALGVATMDGGPMLVHQAARAFTLMTGCAAPLDVMFAAYAATASAT